MCDATVAEELRSSAFVTAIPSGNDHNLSQTIAIVQSCKLDLARATGSRYGKPYCSNSLTEARITLRCHNDACRTNGEYITSITGRSWQRTGLNVTAVDSAACAESVILFLYSTELSKNRPLLYHK